MSARADETGLAVLRVMAGSLRVKASEIAARVSAEVGERVTRREVNQFIYGTGQAELFQFRKRTATWRLAYRASVLTAGQAEAALYFDFEGNKGRLPTLLGQMWPGASKDPLFNGSLVYQAVVEDGLSMLARGGPSDEGDDCHVYPAPLVDELRDLLEEAECHDRLIVSWSAHDLRKTLEGLDDLELAIAFVRRYRDARVTARAWHRKLAEAGGDSFPESFNLDCYRRYFDYEVPEELAGSIVGKAITAARKQALAGRSYDELSDAVRRNWDDMLWHNAFDLDGLKHVAVRLASELAEGERP